MTDIISTARAAGVHPLAMSEEYLPGLQRFAAVFQQEIERLTLTGIHSCHAECQRPVCRLTRERNALLEALRWIDQRCPQAFMDCPLHTIHREMAHDAGACARAAIKALEEKK